MKNQVFDVLEYKEIDLKSKQDLDRLINIFNQLKIPVWIDQGTLLGIVRDNGFIPWDWDIDLSAWYGDWIYSRSFSEELTNNGFQLSILEKSQALRIEPSEKYVGWRQLDIHLYKKVGTHAQAYFYEFDATQVLQKGLLAIITTLDKWQRVLSHEPLSLKQILDFKKKGSNVTIYQKSKNKGFRLICAEFLRLCRHKLFMFRLNKYSILRNVKTPLVWYSSFETISWQDTQYIVPANVADYLEFKYGTTWRTPIRDYDWHNDGAVVRS